MEKIKNHILKLYGEWATNFANNKFFKARLKLTLYYFLGVVFILIFFNLAVFFLFKNNFDYPETILNSVNLEKDEIFSAKEIREEADELIFKSLVTTDLFILLFTLIFSYLYTKKILRPIEEFSQRQEKFTAHAAHELRTPLSVMRAGAENFSQGNFKKEEYQKFISEQISEIDSLINISNNLLSLIKIKNSKNNFENCDIGKIFKKQINIFQKYYHRKNISLREKIEENIITSCNKFDLEIVINNLLKNAVDYNIKNGRVSIEVFKKDKKAVIKIKNTSKGIDLDELKYIFDRFFKSRNNNSENNFSSGLSLSIVNEIIKKHRGKIFVKSEKNKETEFEIWFPLKDAHSNS